MDKQKQIEDKKYITYGGIKEISDIDLDFSPESPSLIDMLIEAKKHAYAENIKANSIVINKNFVKTPYLIFEDGILPPMICGLEVYFATDELPKNYAFAVLEKNKTERELIIEKARKETAERFAERLKAECFDGGIDDKRVAVSFSRLDEIAKELTGDES